MAAFEKQGDFFCDWERLFVLFVIVEFKKILHFFRERNVYNDGLISRLQHDSREDAAGTDAQSARGEKFIIMSVGADGAVCDVRIEQSGTQQLPAVAAGEVDVPLLCGPHFVCDGGSGKALREDDLGRTGDGKASRDGWHVEAGIAESLPHLVADLEATERDARSDDGTQV